MASNSFAPVAKVAGLNSATAPLASGRQSSTPGSARNWSAVMVSMLRRCHSPAVDARGSHAGETTPLQTTPRGPKRHVGRLPVRSRRPSHRPGLGSKRDPRTRRPHRRGLPRPGRVGAGALAGHHGDGCRHPDLRERHREGGGREAHGLRILGERLYGARASARARDRPMGGRTHGILPSPAPSSTLSSRSGTSPPPTASSSTAPAGHPLRDQDDEQVVEQHPPLVPAAGVVAAARARCGAHPRRLGGARRVRAGRRRAPVRAGSTATKRRSRSSSRLATALIDELHRRTTLRRSPACGRADAATRRPLPSLSGRWRSPIERTASGQLPVRSPSGHWPLALFERAALDEAESAAPPCMSHRKALETQPGLLRGTPNIRVGLVGR